VSEFETAHRGPRAVTSLPDALEAAFRAAVCEATLCTSTGAGLADELAARAIFHFDRLQRTSLVFGSIEQAHADLASWAGRFANASLGRRLAHLPPDRVHLAGDRELDLLATGADGRTYAVRFLAFRTRTERLALARRTRAVSPDVASLLLFSLDDGTLRCYRLANTDRAPAPRVAQSPRLAAPV
jgi:hypothetical protein